MQRIFSVRKYNREDKIWEDSTAAVEDGAVEDDLAEEGLGKTLVPERCIKLFVQTASKIAKFRSNQEKEARYIAKNVIQSIESFSFEAIFRK